MEETDIGMAIIYVLLVALNYLPAICLAISIIFFCIGLRMHKKFKSAKYQSDREQFMVLKWACFIFCGIFAVPVLLYVGYKLIQ